MPEYNLKCSSKKCGHEFTAICSFKDYDAGFPGVECPECGKKKVKTFGLNNVFFIGSSDKMNNFEYAAKTNFNKAQVESITAKEEAIKKGVKSPYADLPDLTDNGNRMNFIDDAPQ
jgi:predicted nucleic acid-binding Zn ribbon protein